MMTSSYKKSICGALAVFFFFVFSGGGLAAQCACIKDYSNYPDGIIARRLR